LKINIGRISSAAARQSWRMAYRLAKWLLIICLAIMLGFTWFAVSMLPPLQPWHTERLSGEFKAYKDSKLDFNGYMQREKQLFENMNAEIATWDKQDEAYIYSRFNPDSSMSKLVEGAPFNRSYRLTATDPVGHALLIHGLTDSPYSMKAMAETLNARGFEVTVLRLPGHGTFPSMMTEMTLRDWNAAIRIAARDVASRTPAGQPFYLGGHSTGGTLALQYALDALDDESLRMPDRLLLLSPAINITKVAVVAGFIDALSVVPIPVLEKVRWVDVMPEFDPYKFNSFTVNATRQVNRSARALRSSLTDANANGRIMRMPPVVTWQSAVDSTVGAAGAADVLYPALKGAKHRLVLFDVNRTRAFGSVQTPQARVLIERLQRTPRTYTLDVVGNADAQSPNVSVTRLAPDDSRTVLDTGLQWPGDVISVGHVALPFPADDPVYGFMPGSGHNGIPSIGSWLLRGESGAISVSLGSLTRLRSNPFWPLIGADIDGFVTQDLAAKQGVSARK
jgi:alpha-beta hydrolase superfamily lysophospholipase